MHCIEMLRSLELLKIIHVTCTSFCSDGYKQHVIQVLKLFLQDAKTIFYKQCKSLLTYFVSDCKPDHSHVMRMLATGTKKARNNSFVLTKTYIYYNYFIIIILFFA